MILGTIYKREAIGISKALMGSPFFLPTIPHAAPKIIFKTTNIINITKKPPIIFPKIYIPAGIGFVCSNS